MWSIFRKEVNTFFSALIGYIVIIVFLVIQGLIMFVFPSTSLLDLPYASLDQLFDMAPNIFMFLIPAITMRTLAEEYQQGTFELLVTKPVRDWDIILGKFGACLLLLCFALIPTLLYYLTVYQLGAPPGNLDSGAVLGSYLGLFFLAAAFVAIGIFASALTNNQISAFVSAAFLCFLLYYGFFFFSQLPVFIGRGDDIVEMLGIDYHYRSISRGVLDSRDLLYFVSVCLVFLSLTQFIVQRKKG